MPAGERVPDPVIAETSRPLGELLGHGFEEDRRILEPRRARRAIAGLALLFAIAAVSLWLTGRSGAMARQPEQGSAPPSAALPSPSSPTATALAAPPMTDSPPHEVVDLAPRRIVSTAHAVAAPIRRRPHHTRAPTQVAFDTLPRVFSPSDPPPPPPPRALPWPRDGKQ